MVNQKMSQKLNKPTITNIEQVQARNAFTVHEPAKCQAVVEPELRFEKSVWTVCAFQK